MAARSSGMFPRKGFLVDEATILSGTPVAVGAKVELNIAAYFDAAAVGSVDVKDQDGNTVATLSAPTGGGKVITTRNGYESYGVTSLVLDSASLSAGTAQVSLF